MNKLVFSLILVCIGAFGQAPPPEMAPASGYRPWLPAEKGKSKKLDCKTKLDLAQKQADLLSYQLLALPLNLKIQQLDEDYKKAMVAALEKLGKDPGACVLNTKQEAVCE